MYNTNFFNPHGLSTSKNKSTALDLAILGYYIMKEPLIV